MVSKTANSSLSNTSLYSTASGTGGVVGGHNSMFISREYTLQAFRTMFAVMTKLLYLSAHQQYGNIDDHKPHSHSHDINHSQKSKSTKVDKYAKTQFIIKFRGTELFQSFYKYYKRINGEHDPYFKRMYLYYKENEGHGKHFARRQTQTWDEPFNRKLYDKEIFKISKEKMITLEKSNNEKENKQQKINSIATERKRKFKFPTVEFEMLDEVKEFLTAEIK